MMRTAVCVVLVLALPALAQDHQHHEAHADHAEPSTTTHADHSMANDMPGLLGPSMAREASGTAWQPQSTPLPYPMIHLMVDDWMVMAHGWAYLNYAHAGGPRGDD